MSIHPNPISMAVHVENRRQELLDRARQEWLAREAIASAARTRQRQLETGTLVASRARMLFSRLRPGLAQRVELAQSAPGEVL